MPGMTKRLSAIVLVFLLASAFSFATVSVSGNLVNPATGSVSSRAFVRFWIRGCGGNQARVAGTGVILPSYTDLAPTAGAISGTLYDSLTEISCGGSVGATWYGVQAFYDGKPGPEVPYSVTGASFNLNSATPNTTSPVVSAPTGDSTYQRLDGGNSASGTYFPATNGTLDLGATAARWRTGYFGTSILVPSITLTDVTVSRSAADTLQLATGDSFIPQSSGQLLGGTSNRWAGAFSTADIGTSATSPAFISSTTNPASAGLIRLAKSDVLNFRNNANGADINGVSLDSSNRVVLGGSSGVSIGGGVISSGSAIGITPACSGCSVTVNGAGKAISGTAGEVDINGGAGTAGANGGSIVLTPGSGSTSGIVWINGLIGTYNSLGTQGQGVTWIPCVTSQKSESAADTNVLTCNPPAAAGSYRIRFTEAVSAQNTATLGWTATWTDANGSAHAPTNLALFKAGAAAPALTFVAATNDAYYGSIDIDVDNSATAIVVKTTFAGTSFTSKVTASVERIN